jgi:hypothetical protein
MGRVADYAGTRLMRRFVTERGHVVDVELNELFDVATRGRVRATHDLVEVRKGEFRISVRPRNAGGESRLAEHSQLTHESTV